MHAPIFQFGAFRIDPLARELHEDGQLLSLSPKVFDCLTYLLENRDRAVGRDELISAVWGRADVSDTLLGQTILKARRAVGDTGNEQCVIRTVPRFGYRWVAEVESCDTLTDEATGAAAAASATTARAPPSEPAATAIAPPPAAPEPATEAPVPAHARDLAPPPTIATPSPRRLAWALAGAALLAIALAALATRHWSAGDASHQAPATTRSDTAAPRGTSLAVLPVQVSAPADWSWLRLGLMDLVAGRMREGGLVVVPSDNVVALLRHGNAAEVGHSTGARYLVEPAATRTAQGWVVALGLRDRDGGERRVEGRDTDVVAAARDAADRLLALLGHAVPGRGDARALSVDELLSRTEAATLTDDLATARRLLEDAPPAVQALPEVRLRLAQLDYRAGDLAAARTRLDALLAAVGGETRPVLRGRILNGAGAVAIREDRFADGEQLFAQAVAALEQHNQPAALGQAYTGLGVAKAAQGHYDQAAADFARARVALELAGDNLALARLDENEAVDASKRGRYAQSLAGHQQAAAQFERFGALNELVITLGNIAADQLALLQPRAALATTERGLDYFDRLENGGTRLALQAERVAALNATGQLKAARALLAQMAPTLRQQPDSFLAARAAFEEAQLDFEAGRFADAARLAATATTQYDSPDYRRERALAWLMLTRALRAQGLTADAATQTEQLRAWAAASDVPPLPVVAALAAAEQAWTPTAASAATGDYQRALAEAGRFDVPADTARVAVSWGTRLISQGELEPASTVVGLAARWADRDFHCALLQVR